MATISSLPVRHDPFTYGPALSDHEIRLLSIEPGSSKIRCSLTTHRLSPPLVYDALSYTWGIDRKPFPIICNDKLLYVTKSLFEALGRLRCNGQTALLWVDAVCINQADNDEKSVQVGMMRTIYENAEHVRVWLGPAQETDEAGLELLRRVHRRCGMIQPGDTALDDSSPQQLGLPDTNDASWESVLRILHRPYFSRIWIVQEFLLARRCTILLGRHSIDGDAVLAFGGAFKKYPRLQDTLAINSHINTTWVVDSAWVSPPPGASVTQGSDGSSAQINIPFACNPSFASLWFLKSTLLSLGGLLILELLNHTRIFKSKDPRDRIFALVGLASHFDPEFRRRLVDYSKSLREVQMELAGWLMKNQRSAGSMLFSYAGHGQVRQQQLEAPAPSWVPDWSSASFTWPLAATYYAYDDPALSPQSTVERWFVSHTGLIISCTVLDRVASTVDQVPYTTATVLLRDDEIQFQYQREMEVWDDACWDLATSRNPTHIYAATGERIFDAYWRTLVFDTDPGQRGAKAPPELKMSYQLWSSSFSTVNELRRIQAETLPGLGFFQRTYLSMKFVYHASKLSVQAVRGDAFNVAFRAHAAGRKFCATEEGYIGCVPFAARQGDLVCYFEENTLPFVIRECEDGGYRLIGDCYLHGLMRGPGQAAVMRTGRIELN